MTEQKRKFRYSEIFKSFQGEGNYTGIPTLWWRAWGCNFECLGFGQENQENRESWVLDYQEIDVSKYQTMEELPVFKKGCDSSYSWSKKFSHLAHQGTAKEISQIIRGLLTNEFNPEGKFQHHTSKQWTHMAFTGGEPMMSQTGLAEVMEQFLLEEDVPKYVTIETNGTQSIRNNFKSFFQNKDKFSGELFWSVSPKLYLSGEKWEEAIRPEIVKEYSLVSNTGQLKYVSNGTQKSWDEVAKANELYRNAGINWPVWIMPVGADIEGQNRVAATISDQAINRGYNVSARVHTYVYGNVIGK